MSLWSSKRAAGPWVLRTMTDMSSRSVEPERAATPWGPDTPCLLLLPTTHPPPGAEGAKIWVSEPRLCPACENARNRQEQTMRTSEACATRMCLILSGPPLPHLPRATASAERPALSPGTGEKRAVGRPPGWQAAESLVSVQASLPAETRQAPPSPSLSAPQSERRDRCAHIPEKL